MKEHVSELDRETRSILLTNTLFIVIFLATPVFGICHMWSPIFQCIKYSKNILGIIIILNIYGFDPP